MKPLRIAALFGALSLLFMGCPYESKFTLGDASNAIADQSLVAKKWDCKGEEDYVYKVELEGTMYKITKKDTKNGGEPTYYKGFITPLGDALFLNVYEVDKDGNPTAEEIQYYYYKVEKMDGDASRVKLRAVTDNITEEFESATEFRDFVKKNMGISFFYNKDDEKVMYKD
ncbi:MAG: hypothetical protein HY064_14020 [Bacteroidetes bacterium]|nr:hypothetical protein [Bacteroidota bacterium]